MSVRCRVQELIRVLVELRLPEELARDLVYKWKVVEHPVAIALRTDPWLRRVRERYELCVPTSGRYANIAPNSTCCVCPRNYTKGEGFDWESGHIHGHVTPRFWSLVSEKSRAWRRRTCGPPKNPHVVMTVRCNRSILCMRYFRHTIPTIDAKIRETCLLDQGLYVGADCVTNEDCSLATWLRYAPQWALEEYLQRVTGWTEKELDNRLETKFGDWYVTRGDVVRMCLKH